MYSQLLEEWLGAVNQPVVDSVQAKVRELLIEISNCNNFNKEQQKQILIEIINES